VIFTSEYQYSIDEKGRLIVPKSFRDILGNRYMMSKGLEACLSVYPLDVWAKLAEKINSLNDFNPQNRALKLRFFSGSGEGEIDRQGRTLINHEFRNHAHLTKDVYIVGSGDHVQIWDKKLWEEYRDGPLENEYTSNAEAAFQ